MLLHEALGCEHEELRRDARRVAERGDWGRAGELGFAGIAVPEARGGAGLGHGALTAVLEELGRGLAPAAPLCAAIAAEALVRGGDRAGLLPRLLAGDVSAAVSVGEGLVLGAEGAGLFLLEGTLATSARVTLLPSLDPSRPLARVAAAGEPLGVEVVDVARVLLAAEQLGGAARCLEISVAHARTREQFGRPIGSFQAIKHTLADMLTRVEAARSACRFAAWVLDHSPAELPEAAAIAAVTCGEAYLLCAGDAVQVHGGIGFTWEHEAGRHLKRARASAAYFGGAGGRREAVAGWLGL